MLLAVYTLWEREMTRFYRQPSRVLGVLATPFVFWLFIGAGFGSSFQLSGADEGTDYLAYFYPGTILMIVLFTAIFSTFSLIQDRQEGFLQSVLVSPVPRLSIVLGKVLGTTTLATVQGTLFLVFLPFLDVDWDMLLLINTTVAIFLNAFVLTALGFVIAWKVNSVQGFHVIMNLFLMPFWFLSGSLFPQSSAPQWIQWVMQINPLTYGLALIRSTTHIASHDPELPSFFFSLTVYLTLGIVLLVYSANLVNQRKSAVS